MDRALIVFARGQAANGNVDRMVGALADAFARRGFETRDLDTTDRPAMEDLQRQVAAGRVGLLVAMNVGMEAILANAPWLKGVPLFLYQLDHPYLVYPAVAGLIGAVSAAVEYIKGRAAIKTK